MSDPDLNITGGNGEGFFDVDWLTNLIVPFEFTFEGRALKGQWYRYKTTTPDWIQNSVSAARETIKEHGELQEKIDKSENENEIAELRKRMREIETKGTRARYAWLAHSIVSWNATSKGEPIPISEQVFNSIPVPFLIALGDHLASTRTGQNPT